MKLVGKCICVCIMIISLSFLLMSFFVERLYQPTYIQRVIDQIDLMSIVEEQISDDYKKAIDKLKDTKEFQTIVYDYAHAFGLYLYNGNETYSVSEVQEKELFTQYSSIFLKQYPQLQLLPANLFIEFLVERIDLNDYLPTFESLKDEIPIEYWDYLNLILDKTNRIKCIIIFLIAYIVYLMICRKLTLVPIALSFVFVIMGLCFVYKGYFISCLPSHFSTFENVIILLTKELQVEIKYCIMSLVSCLCLEWGIYYAKKIFLF